MQYLKIALAVVACLLGGVSAQLDGCNPDPCERGTCEASIDQYICQCPETSAPFYYGPDCNILTGAVICPGGHIYETNQVRTYNNLPHRANCFYLVAIPNAAYIEIEFLSFDVETAKDEVVIGSGPTVDESRTNIADIEILDNSRSPINNPDFPNNIVTISGSRAWISVNTDKNVMSPGYSFRVLAETLDCVLEPCQNGGTCIDLTNAFECNCPAGYTGDLCEIKLDFCNSNPCVNGGTCTADNFGYTCDCVAGWTDVNCQTNINECLSMPCLNGATCIDGINQWSCQCASQYTGETCQISLDPCGSSPCYNGATCTNAGLDYVCECAPGFAGVNCEIDINECTSLPCQNGATCINGIALYTCQCRQGFSGINCEEVGFCDLEGEWYNECNDRVTVTLTSTGMILGHYSSNIGLLTGYMAPNVMVGYADQACDFPSFGFVVTTDNGKSTSSWSGQCHLCGGEEVLYTTWTNTQRVSTCVDIKKATSIGQDRWTRYKQSQAPREGI
ncbi:fibropellin-1 [Strongylocentrotus purpuratus]|uniref:EGF-like domain-containing protein n=1 Tax=Strongylocentrotus purpuratus TaxID=7668 RepID=A0A7M7LWJ7_STRPU|nr:fibropellin-1 [Strongylocentrotus purpuratus]